MTRRIAAITAATVVTGSALVAVAPDAWATTINVDTTAESATDGHCSLREAIRAANTDRSIDTCPAGSAYDVINVPSSTSPYQLTLGTLELFQPMTLQGAGVVVGTTDDYENPMVQIGAGSSVVIDGLTLLNGRLVTVLNDGNLTMNAVTVRGGHSGMGDFSSNAAPGLTNRGTATLVNSAVVDNQHDFGGPAGAYNAPGARLTISHSTFSGNRSVADGYVGPTILNDGRLAVDHTVLSGNSSGLLNSGSLTVDRSLFSGSNSFFPGDGISSSGQAAVTLSTFSNNSVGIVNTGTMTVDYSAVRDNHLQYRPGAGGIDSTGTLTVRHSSVTGNTGVGAGGIRTTGTLVLQDTTVADNAATGFENLHSDQNGNPSGAGGLAVLGGTSRLTGVTLASNDYHVYPYDSSLPPPGSASGGLNNVGGSVTVADSVLAYNTQDQPEPRNGQDCTGPVTSLGYNVLQHPQGCTGAPTTGDRIGIDPLLGPLADNGGPTLSLTPRPGSPLIDKGGPAAPGSTLNACTAYDQRGAKRPRDGNGDGFSRCDIGAVDR